ncbi:MAG: ABC transporter substrate-binding protein [Clostridiaceae bacterium]|nr:ABC transporter substrate-binding protein [Clostridiaceae bacterium]
MKKKVLILLLVFCFLATTILTGCQSAGQKKTPLVIYNWGEYIAGEEDTYTLYGKDYPIKDVIAEFEKAYPQYDVNYQTFDDNEKMYPKLDKESFDIIVPSDYMVVRLIKEGMLQPLDMSKMPNVGKYLDTRLSTLQYDSDKSISDQVANYAVPYMYCTVGLIYNQDVLGKITSNKPQDVWKILFDAKQESKIGMYSSMRESIGVALNYLGYSLNSMDEKQLEEAKQLLIEQRKTVKPLLGIDELKDKYVSGELVAGVAWSGDHAVCRQKLEDGGEDPETLQYVLPEGSNLSVDMMCIPKNAVNPTGAMDFINFMYQPDIALMNAVYVGYSSPNTAVIEALPPEITNNKSYYPDAETIKTLEIYYSSDEIDSTYDRIWQTILAN